MKWMPKVRNVCSRIITRWPIAGLFLAVIVGMLLWGAFNWSLEVTNTESFCISCHEMEANVYAEYKNSVHYANRTGVRASCPDCHVPRSRIHKVVHKVLATNELYHWAIGSIDTREKFLAKRPRLAASVWEGMSNTDSRECLNCHDKDYMVREMLEQDLLQAANLIFLQDLSRRSISQRFANLT